MKKKQERDIDDYFYDILAANGYEESSSWLYTGAVFAAKELDLDGLYIYI